LLYFLPHPLQIARRRLNESLSLNASDALLGLTHTLTLR
jgi:hypothetical protein